MSEPCVTCSPAPGAVPAPCPTCRPAATAPAATDAGIQSAYAQNRAARQQALADLGNPDALRPTGVRSMPEDGNYDPTRYWLAVPPATDNGPPAGTDLELARSMAEIGRREGFDMVVVADQRGQQAVTGALGGDASGVQFVTARTDDYDTWVEDSREMDPHGGIHVPARAAGALGQIPVYDNGRGIFQRDELHEGRRQRLGTPENLASYRFSKPIEDFSVSGQVQMNQQQDSAAGHAAATGRSFTEGLSYVEGGNILRGQAPDGSAYAVVGQDSVHATRGNLSRELGRPVTDAEARRAIGYDFGVDPSRVYPVEQPGDFHLDMAMTPTPSGAMLLNDSREAARLQEQWLRDDLRTGADPSLTEETVNARVSRIREDAERTAWYEDITQRDLERQGITVHRVAGAFNEHDSNGMLRPNSMNFLNGEGGIGPDGKHYQILLGGDPRAQAYIQDQLTNRIPTGIDRVHFLPRSITEANLPNMGALNCRIKGEGNMTPCPSCRRPVEGGGRAPGPN